MCKLQERRTGLRFPEGRCGMLDVTDRAILAILFTDATISNRTVAEMVGVSQGTVSNRIKRMEQLGIIEGYSIRLNPEKIGWRMTVVVGIRIEKGRLLEIQGKIAEDPRVVSVYDVTGDYDSMVVALARDREDLNNFTKTVLSLDGIERSHTHMVLNTVKNTWIGMPEDTESFD